MSVAVVTLASSTRMAHLEQQQLRLSQMGVQRVIVGLDTVVIDPSEHAALDGAHLGHVPPSAHGLRLAAARNRGAAIADSLGCSLLVFLDADCVPGPDLIRRYRTAHAGFPGALLCGPVTYLPEGVDVAGGVSLTQFTAPHPARPALPPGEVRVAREDERALFWSLSFALSPAVFARIGGFDRAYTGYGGEDTDFSMRARRADVSMCWVGGADAYHQWHPNSVPPWQHLDDILRNGRLFADRWGWWPMSGWLDAFVAAGAVVRDGTGYRRA